MSRNTSYSKSFHFVASLSAGMALSMFSNLSNAALFQIWEQSAMGAGFAHADMAAGALDASTAYYNPAGMTRFDEMQITGGGMWLQQHTSLKGVTTTTDGVTDPVTGSGLNSNFQTGVPNLHLVYPFKDAPFDTVFGFSIASPFDYAVYYNNPETNAYTKKVSQKSILLSPSLAFEIRGFSVGAGMDVQVLQSKYKAIPYITDYFSGIPYTVPVDLSTDVEAWDIGWNIGLLYEFTERTRMGATYRSKTSYDQTGKTRLEGFPEFDFPLKFSTDANVVLPATTTFGIYHDVSKQFALMASGAFVQWDMLDGFYNSYSYGSNLDYDIPLNLENSWFFAIGAAYKPTKHWILRTGFNYDQTPTSDENREMNFPDSDRYTFAAGLGYVINDEIQIDGSYQFVYSPIVSFSNPNGEGGEITGDAKRFSNIVGLQLTWNFAADGED